MIICIGPFCIPVLWGLPFFAALFLSIKRWFMESILGRNAVPDPVPLPDAVSEGETVHHAHSATEFDAMVRKHPVVVLDFTAEWCKPCKSIAPVFDDLSKRFPSLHFVKIDVDELEDIAARYKVSAMPTFVAIRNEQEFDRMVGANKSELQEFVSRVGA